MTLTVTARNLINNSGTRNKIAIALGCTELTVIRYINSNSDNLTKAAAIKIIKKETGLSEREILTESVSTAKVA